MCSIRRCLSYGNTICTVDVFILVYVLQRMCRQCVASIAPGSLICLAIICRRQKKTKAFILPKINCLGRDECTQCYSLMSHTYILVPEFSEQLQQNPPKNSPPPIFTSYCRVKGQTRGGYNASLVHSCLVRDCLFIGLS